MWSPLLPTGEFNQSRINPFCCAALCRLSCIHELLTANSTCIKVASAQYPPPVPVQFVRQTCI